MREQIEKEEAEQVRQAQEEGDLEMAEQLQEDTELDARRQEAEAWELQQAMNPNLNPLLLPREDRYGFSFLFFNPVYNLFSLKGQTRTQKTVQVRQRTEDHWGSTRKLEI